MVAKEARFSTEAREKMLRGVDTLANAVKVTLGPNGSHTRPRRDVWIKALREGLCG